MPSPLPFRPSGCAAMRGLTALSRPLLALHLAVGSLLALTGWTGDAAAQSAETAVRRYDIPAGPLSAVLTRFSAEAGIFLAGASDLAQGKTSPGVRGSFSVPAALEALLAGTGLAPQRNAQGQYGLRAAPASAADVTLLPSITVRGAAASGGMGPPPPAYAGGQVASGGRVGLLGNKDVMDTPFSQTSFTQELIQNQQGRTLADVLVNDASVAVEAPPGSGWEGVNMRGIRGSDGTESFSFNGLFDVLPRYIVGVDMAERVEVLKGPSALLNGMPTGNAIGGTVNMVSKRAGEEPLSRLTTSFVSPGQPGLSVDLGRRFGPEKAFGLRFNGGYRDGDLWPKPQKEALGSAVLGLDWRSDRVRLSADVGYQNLQIDSANRPFWVADGLPVPALPSQGQNPLPPWLYWNTASTFGMVQGEVDITSKIAAYAAIGGRVSDDDSLFVNPTLLTARGDWSEAPNRNRTHETALSGLAGVRASFDTGPVGHQLNLNASGIQKETASSSSGFVTALTVRSNLYAPAELTGPYLAVGTPRKSSETTRSSFGIADTLSLFDERIQLTAGIRRQTVGSSNFSAATGAKSSGYDASAWTPSYALVLKPWENVSVYGNYIEGLQPGTTVGSTYANAGTVFAPYQSKQYEAGVKIDWGGSLMTTIGVFQIAQPSTISIPGKPLPTLALDGEQRNRGIEANIFGEPWTGLRLFGGVMVIDAKLSKTQGGINDGKRAPGIPQIQASLGGEWDTSFTPGLTLTGRLRFSGETYLEAANRRTVPAWTQLDLGARYALATPWTDKPVVVRLSVENALDNNYWISRTVGSLAQARPRTVLLSTAFDF